jgi:hypothetical protein
MTSTIVDAVFHTSLPSHITTALIYLLLAVLMSLCLRASDTKKLLKTASAIYYLLSIITGRTTSGLIYGPAFWTASDGEVDAVRAAADCLLNFATATLMMVGIAWQDALPMRVFPQRVRVVALFFVALYKSKLYA